MKLKLETKRSLRLLLFFSLLFGLLHSCTEDAETILDENNLSEYMALNSSLAIGDLVACAAGKENGLTGVQNAPTDVFFYPIEGATDFRYFESEIIAEPNNFANYTAKPLPISPIFNGYLLKFENTAFAGERMGVVTYKTEGKLHHCEPIRIKTNTKPTEVNAELAEVIENKVTPSFRWNDGIIKENVIYFHVISDSENNFISGTYTIEKNFTFYDLSNVVFNITDPSITPVLEPNANYKYTMMGVSEDNWVNLFLEKSFRTE